MSDSKPSTSSRGKPLKVDMKRLQAQHDAMQLRINELRDSLAEKDMLIKGQRQSLRQYEQKNSRLESHNLTLRHVIGILTSYIQEELNEVLPPLPSLSEEEEMEVVSAKPAKGKKQRKQEVSEKSSAMDHFQTAFKQPQGGVTGTLLFDEHLSQNMFKDFMGAELLRHVLDAQLEREEMQKITKFLLGKGSKSAFLFKTRTVLFESLSFYLSLRNVAIQNSVDEFLPRVLEMLVDILEIERVALFLYDEAEDYFYSKAVTAELPQQVVLNKDFGHIAHAGEKSLVLNSPYDDPRFDARYDQMTSFISRNLACVPLRQGDKLIGVLECSNKRTTFNSEDLALMSQVARQLAAGLSAESAKEKMKELSQKAISSRGTIESAKDALLTPLLYSLAEAIKTQVNCERCTVFLHDEASQELVSLLASDLEGIIRVPTKAGLASLSFTSGKVVNVENAQLHGLFHPEVDRKTGFQTKQVLAVPIGQRGVLQCLNKKNMIQFSKTDEARAQSMAEVVNTLLDSLDGLDGLLRSTDFNELCLQAVTEAILQVGSDGALRKVNRFAAELFKLSPEKMAGASLAEIFENSQELLSKIYECIRQEKTTTFKKERLVLPGPSTDLKYVDVDLSCVLISGLEQGSSYVIVMQRC